MTGTLISNPPDLTGLVQLGQQVSDIRTLKIERIHKITGIPLRIFPEMIKNELFHLVARQAGKARVLSSLI